MKKNHWNDIKVEEIKNKLDFLIKEHGFKITSSIESKESFGDWMLRYENGKMIIIALSDRGQKWISLSLNSTEKTVGLNSIIGKNTQIDDEILFLRENIAKLKELFESEKVESFFTEILKKRNCENQKWLNKKYKEFSANSGKEIMIQTIFYAVFFAIAFGLIFFKIHYLGVPISFGLYIFSYFMIKKNVKKESGLEDNKLIILLLNALSVGLLILFMSSDLIIYLSDKMPREQFFLNLFLFVSVFLFSKLEKRAAKRKGGES